MPLFGAPGQRIGYEVYPHPGEAPPVVLIHGFTASAASFEANLDGLRRNFTVITAELLGHGASDAPEEAAAYGAAPAVRRVLDLMDHLGYESVFVCGHSLGGALALRVALDAPHRVAALAVINSSSAAGTPEWRDSARPSMVELAQRVREDGTEFLKRTRMYPAHSRRLDPISKDLLTRDFDRLLPAGVAGTAESLVVDVNAWERHGELSVPMLLVVGDKDVDFARNAEAFVERFPPHMVQTVHLAHAGHAANIEQPREFEQALVDFARMVGYLRVPGEAAASSNKMLTALGGSLVLAGIGLLAAAIIFTSGDGDDDSPVLAAAVPTDPPTEVVSTPTQEMVTAVAGTRIPGPGPVNVGGQATQAAQTPTAQPTATAIPPTATNVPANNDPDPTAIPEPEPTSTPEPTPVPTAVTGPRAVILGPRTAEPGSTEVYSADTGGALRVDWQTPGGPKPISPAVAVTFGSAGCYPISMTATFSDSPTQSTSIVVSVGGADCGG